MINTVVVIFATKIMNLFGNGCVHNVKKLIFLQKSLEFSIILNNKVYICSIFYKISIFFIEIIITRLVHPAPTSFWYIYN